MITKFIEATNEVNGRPFNYGKFMVARFTSEEWRRRTVIENPHGEAIHLLSRCGWESGHVMVFDLQTGEGALFRPGGYVKADLDKHKVWVCPLFEPFLAWLYGQDLADLDQLPAHVHLKDAPAAMAGYRRGGGDA